MKKLKCLFFIVISVLIVLSGCSNATIDYDSIIIENATRATAEFEFNFDSNPFANGSRYFTVKKVSDRQFSVDVNGKEMTLNNKIMKRNNNSKRNILESEKNKNENNILNSPQTSSKKKQQQLYYITSKEEKNKILFTK